MNDEDDPKGKPTTTTTVGTEPAKPPAMKLVRTDPRLTMHSLTDYLTCPPGHRYQILLDQKRPKTPPRTYYRETETAIAQALGSGGTDMQPITDTIQRLKQPTPKAAQEARQDAGVDALEAFDAWVKDTTLDLGSLRSAPLKHVKPMVLGLVSVSVRPEAYIVDDAGQTVGCVKLLLPKGSTRSAARVAYAGTILFHYMQETLGLGPLANPAHCVLLDVVGKRTWTAPDSMKRRWKHVVDACAEIERVWSKI